MELKYTLSEEFLSPGEQSLFSAYLKKMDVDETIWELYPCFFKKASKWTRPHVLRVFKDEQLVAAVLLIKCRHVGKSLFRSPLLYKPVDWLKIPVWLWLKVGFGPEVIANPGFFTSNSDKDLIAEKIIRYLGSRSVAFFITDLRRNDSHHGNATIFSYVDEGSVDVSEMSSIQDYIDKHKNLKKKIRSFKNKEGTIEILRGKPEKMDRSILLNCCESTMRKSFVHTPFQDAFLGVIEETLHCDSSSFIHMIAKMNGEITGYHSFLQTGSTLRMMHGAFNRDMKSTYHAYENLILASIDFAINQQLKKVYFGPIMNETKRRMMQTSDPCATYFHSKNPVMRNIFAMMYSKSQLQNKKLMAFATK
jgi:hypothetical protein